MNAFAKFVERWKFRRSAIDNAWSFEIHGDRFVQRLTGLIALCPDGHRCQHIGLAETHGEIALVRTQLASING